MRQYLQPTQGAGEVQILQDAVTRFAVSPSVVSGLGNAIRWTVIQGAIGGSCCFVQGGTTGGLQITSTKLLTCMFMTKLSKTHFMIVA